MHRHSCMWERHKTRIACLAFRSAICCWSLEKVIRSVTEPGKISILTLTGTSVRSSCRNLLEFQAVSSSVRVYGLQFTTVFLRSQVSGFRMQTWRLRSKIHTSGFSAPEQLFLDPTNTVRHAFDSCVQKYVHCCLASSRRWCHCATCSPDADRKTLRKLLFQFIFGTTIAFS